MEHDYTFVRELHETLQHIEDTLNDTTVLGMTGERYTMDAGPWELQDDVEGLLARPDLETEDMYQDAFKDSEDTEELEQTIQHGYRGISELYYDTPEDAFRDYVRRTDETIGHIPCNNLPFNGKPHPDPAEIEYRMDDDGDYLNVTPGVVRLKHEDTRAYLERITETLLDAGFTVKPPYRDTPIHPVAPNHHHIAISHVEEDERTVDASYELTPADD